MRKLLVISVLALVAGASIIWLLQQGSGYVLISLGDTSIEMSALVAAALRVETQHFGMSERVLPGR